MSNKQNKGSTVQINSDEELQPFLDELEKEAHAILANDYMLKKEVFIAIQEVREITPFDDKIIEPLLNKIVSTLNENLKMQRDQRDMRLDDYFKKVENFQCEAEAVYSDNEDGIPAFDFYMKFIEHDVRFLNKLSVNRPNDDGVKYALRLHRFILASKSDKEKWRWIYDFKNFMTDNRDHFLDLKERIRKSKNGQKSVYSIYEKEINRLLNDYEGPKDIVNTYEGIRTAINKIDEGKKPTDVTITGWLDSYREHGTAFPNS